MKKSILFIDQFREVTGGQVVLQSLVKVAQDASYHVGVLAPMGGGLEAALKARWGEKIARHDLHELSLQSGRKGWRDAARLLAFSFYLLRFLRLISSYGVIYVNGGRLTLPLALLSLLTVRPRWIYHIHLCHSGLEKRLLSLIARLPRTGSMVLASSYIQEDFARAQPPPTAAGTGCHRETPVPAAAGIMHGRRGRSCAGAVPSRVPMRQRKPRRCSMAPARH